VQVHAAGRSEGRAVRRRTCRPCLRSTADYGAQFSCKSWIGKEIGSSERLESPIVGLGAGWLVGVRSTGEPVRTRWTGSSHIERRTRTRELQRAVLHAGHANRALGESNFLTETPDITGCSARNWTRSKSPWHALCEAMQTGSTCRWPSNCLRRCTLWSNRRVFG
jgi:hypothetical protein